MSDDDVLLPGSIEDWPLMRATCCRDWPVFMAVPLKPCGLCRTIPTVVGPWGEP